MNSTLQRRLPGVSFDVPAPPLDEVLPRMDIAFFVGFSARGPLNLPVAVESLGEFEDVFGGELTLLERPDGSVVRGLLHPALRQFFSHGGRRAWVQRVAADHAQTTRFPLQNLLMLCRQPATAESVAPGIWHAEPAWVAARCPGSWADSLMVSAQVDAQPLGTLPLAFDGEQLTVAAQGPTGLALGRGDVLRIQLPANVWVQGRIVAIGAPTIDRSTRQMSRQVVLSSLATLQAATHAGELVRLAWSEPTGGGEGSIEQCASAYGHLGKGRAALSCMLPASARLGQGEVVRVSMADGSPAAWLALDAVELTAIGDAQGRLSARLAGTVWQVPGALSCASIGAWLAGNSPAAAQWLRASLVAIESDATVSRLVDLALVPRGDGTPSLFDLPDDTHHFAELTPRRSTRAVQAFELEGRAPRPSARFPLASVPCDGELMLLPLLIGPATASGLGARGIGVDPLQRDGLDSFDWQLFAETALAGQHANGLADQAEALRLLGRTPRPLRGMHALFGTAIEGPVEEPTLLLIPDAVQRGWVRQRRRSAAQRIEVLTLPAEAVPCGCFQECAPRPVPRPTFLPEADPDKAGNFKVSWSIPLESTPSDELVYELQEASNSNFAPASIAYEGSDSHLAVTSKPRGTLFYRVRASLGAQRGAWSDTLEVTVDFSGYELRPWSDADLVTLHRLMLRTAAARGDMLALLGLPEHYRWTDALGHAQKLRSPTAETEPDGGVPPLGEDEDKALSHGALQHPWLLTRRANEVISCPPDGAVAGQLASRALTRGAWIAVANTALKDVVALSLPASDDERQALLEAQINPVVSGPAGFVLGSSETLLLDADWRAVSVRRLMCLLRRAALQRGAQYVFEPNGDALRRTVERAFEALLAELKRRGAFSGLNANDSYRVEVGDEQNPPAHRDAGQFRVDLKVAPALPLTFLTVRLAREGARLAAQELR